MVRLESTRRPLGAPDGSPVPPARGPSSSTVRMPCRQTTATAPPNQAAGRDELRVHGFVNGRASIGRRPRDFSEHTATIR